MSNESGGWVKRMIVRRLVYVAIGLAVAAVLSLIGTAVGAHAAPPADRDPRPAGGYEWGVPIADLPACTNAASGPANNPTGGWSGRDFLTLGRDDTNTPVAPTVMTLGEVCRNPDRPNGARIGIPIAYSRLAYASSAPRMPQLWVGYYPTTGAIDGPTSTDVFIRCQTTEWATSRTARYGGLNGSYPGGSYLNAGAFADSTERTHQFNGYINVATSPQATDSVCPFIHSVQTIVCKWVAGSTGEVYGEDYTCHGTTWSAEQWFTKKPYKPEPPLVQVCLAPGIEHADCAFILPDQYVDGTDFDQVCAGAPAPAWLDFSWLPNFVGHYARCLFAPANGFDRGSWISTNWESSAAGDIGASVAEVADSFAFSSSCGVLFSTSAIVPLTINTCDWNAWAGPLRLIVGIGVLVLFCWWAVGFLTSSILSIVNRKMPNPLTHGDKGGDD